MKISSKGLDIIKYEEGLRLKAYKDKAGHLTIGWGHKDDTMSPNLEITLDQAEIMLRNDLHWVESALQGFNLNQNEFDALCSLIFNIGHGAFLSSTIRRRLIEENMESATKEFTKWVWITIVDEAGNERKVIDPVLVRRRAKEKNLFITPCK